MNDGKIVEFPKKAFNHLPEDKFRKALAAIFVINDSGVRGRDLLLLIDRWIGDDLITEDERDALHQFYGVIP
jgi:hypothetical protein